MIEKGITMERRRGPETRRLVTVVLLFCALAIPLFAVAGCGKQLARMEENQVKLQAMIAANARELTTISSQLHTGQGKINESIQDLDGDTQQVAANVVTVQKDQQQLQNTVAAGNEGLNRRIGSVQDNQRTLQGSVAQVSDVTQRTAANLTSLSQQHTALHQMVQANQQQLASGIGTVVNNQQRIQTGIGDLRHANEGLAGDIASVSAKHDTMYATLQNNDKQMAERLAALASGDRQLCDDIANVHTFLQTVATNLTAANASLKDQLGTSHESLTAQVAGLAASQQQLRAGVDSLGGKADQATAQLVDAKSSLQETLKVSREVLTGQMAASLQNQQALQSDVRGISDKTDKLTSDIGAVSTEQAAIHNTMRAHHDVVITAMAGLSDRDDALRAGIDKLDGKADRTVGSIASLTSQQQSLYEAVKANHDVVVTKLADVSDNQAKLQAGVGSLDGKADAIASTQNHLGQATRQVASDVATMTAGQNALHQTLKTHSDKINEQVAGVANAQKETKTSLDTLTATTGQTSLDILALGNNQTKLTQTVNAGVADLGARTDKTVTGLTAVAAGQASVNDTLNRQGQALSSQMAKIADSQKQTQSSLDTLTAVTGQASLDVLALRNNQKELTQTVKAGVADLGPRTDKVAERLTAVAAGQTTLSDTLNRQGQALSSQMAKVTDGQQQMQSSLNTLTATAGQTALDVLAMTARQEAVRAALQSHDETSGTRMAKLADTQQQMQSSLDTVTAITGQASLDTLALSNRQGELGQAVQAGRQEMAGKLAVMAQDQQNWSSRLDAAQAKVGTIAGSIAALEQQITKLQEALQAGLQGTTATLGATSQQRQQFEAKVGQDIQAVIDSLAQLRQTQTSLHEQLTQVQKSTQGQADSIRSVIEQIKTTPNTDGRVTERVTNVQDRVGASEPKQPPAEFGISAAAERPQAPIVAESAK